MILNYPVQLQNQLSNYWGISIKAKKEYFFYISDLESQHIMPAYRDHDSGNSRYSQGFPTQVDYTQIPSNYKDFNAPCDSLELFLQSNARKRRLQLYKIPKLPSFDSDEESTSTGESPKSGTSLIKLKNQV